MISKEILNQYQGTMGYCEICEVYYKKLTHGDMCKHCAHAIVGTPPSPNNAFRQFEALLEKKYAERNARNRYLQQASLMDLAADVIIKNVSIMTDIENFVPEGNPPWYALLRSWYRLHKQRPRSLSTEKTPKRRLIKLMQFSSSTFQITE